MSKRTVPIASGRSPRRSARAFLLGGLRPVVVDAEAFGGAPRLRRRPAPPRWRRASRRLHRAAARPPSELRTCQAEGGVASPSTSWARASSPRPASGQRLREERASRSRARTPRGRRSRPTRRVLSSSSGRARARAGQRAELSAGAIEAAAENDWALAAAHTSNMPRHLERLHEVGQWPHPRGVATRSLRCPGHQRLPPGARTGRSVLLASVLDDHRLPHPVGRHLQVRRPGCRSSDSSTRISASNRRPDRSSGSETARLASNSSSARSPSSISHVIHAARRNAFAELGRGVLADLEDGRLPTTAVLRPGRRLSTGSVVSTPRPGRRSSRDSSWWVSSAHASTARMSNFLLGREPAGPTPPVRDRASTVSARSARAPPPKKRQVPVAQRGPLGILHLVPRRTTKIVVSSPTSGTAGRRSRRRRDHHRGACLLVDQLLQKKTSGDEPGSRRARDRFGGISGEPAAEHHHGGEHPLLGLARADCRSSRRSWRAGRVRALVPGRARLPRGALHGEELATALQTVEQGRGGRGRVRVLVGGAAARWPSGRRSSRAQRAPAATAVAAVPSSTVKPSSRSRIASPVGEQHRTAFSSASRAAPPGPRARARASAAGPGWWPGPAGQRAPASNAATCKPASGNCSRLSSTGNVLASPMLAARASSNRIARIVDAQRRRDHRHHQPPGVATASASVIGAGSRRCRR